MNIEGTGREVGRELVLTRTLSAPRALVFKAWTDPEQVAMWWGPRGFTNPVCEVDARPGGAIRIDMRGPDGTVYPMTGAFQELVEPERIVFTSAALDERGEPFFEVLTTVTLADQNGGTGLTVQARVLWSTGAAASYIEGMEEGWTQTLDRLGEHVAGMVAACPGQREFVITRAFDAPRDLVWKAWTEPERLKRWWGPKGFAVTHCTNDLRPGGLMHYRLRGTDGLEMWGKWTYREIAPPQRLVVVSAFSDERGGLGRHPLAPDWPREMLSTFTFTEHQGKTTIVVEWLPLNATAVERSTFDNGRESMRQGWGGTFDRLAEYLAGG